MAWTPDPNSVCSRRRHLHIAGHCCLGSWCLHGRRRVHEDSSYQHRPSMFLSPRLLAGFWEGTPRDRERTKSERKIEKKWQRREKEKNKFPYWHFYPLPAVNRSQVRSKTSTAICCIRIRTTHLSHMLRPITNLHIHKLFVSLLLYIYTVSEKTSHL